MRTKILYRLAAGTCSVCLCYGLVVQALTGEVTAEALTPEMSAWEQVLNTDAAETRGSSAPEQGNMPAEQSVFLPYEGKGKRRGVHGEARFAQSAESYTPAESAEEEKQRVPESSGDDAGQQTSSSGNPPTLSQFLSALRCGGCRHNCCLLSPRCMKGRSKQQSATVQYTQTYGG